MGATKPEDGRTHRNEKAKRGVTAGKGKTTSNVLKCQMWGWVLAEALKRKKKDGYGCIGQAAVSGGETIRKKTRHRELT